MSTNYYFKVVDAINISFKGNDSIIKKDLMETLNQELSKASYIHIGKRSVGWKPLFQRTKYFSSVEEIEKFYNENKENLIIINEYEETLSFKDLKMQLIDWNKDKPDVNEHESDGYITYYQDKDGFDFSLEEFS